MFAIIVSVFNIATISFCTHTARVIVRLVLSGFPRVIAEELVSTLEYCAVCFELALVCDNYGKTMFVIGLYVMNLWWGSCWGDATANPNTHLEDIVRGECEPREAGYKIGAQTVAGLAVWRVVRYLWGLGYSNLHLGKSRELTCLADLQVSVIKGAAVECIITFIDRMNGLSQRHYTWQYSNVFNAILSTGLVVAGLDYSGGYFNPVLAMSLKMGCTGHNLLEHVIVYWLASVVGSMIALKFYRVITTALGMEGKQLQNGELLDGKKHKL